MAENTYEKLAQKLDACPSGFPRTDSGIELRLLKKIFLPEEAALAVNMLPGPETADQMAKRIGRDPAETAKTLDTMAKKGQIGGFPMGEERAFIFLPFIVGLYFFQVGSVDEELARLFEEYHRQWAEGVFGTRPTHHRVVSIDRSIPVELEVLPYERAATILRDARSYGLYPCMCKLQKTHIGEGCNHPVMSCLVYSPAEGAFDGMPGIQVLTKEEAFQALRDFEDAGLVHSAGNFREGTGVWDYICSCCPCSCTFLRALSEYGIQNSMAKTNFYAVVEKEACEGSKTCLTRCHFKAISVIDGVSNVNRQLCTGCGLCVITCPSKALSLVRKPEDEAVRTPKSLQEWNEERAGNRVS